MSGYTTAIRQPSCARHKLCLRATTDYWVGAIDGQPFFMINKAVDPGLLTVLENEIVPRLEREVTCQPSLFEQVEKPLVPRFTLIFDREEYSPIFFQDVGETFCLPDLP